MAFRAFVFGGYAGQMEKYKKNDADLQNFLIKTN